MGTSLVKFSRDTARDVKQVARGWRWGRRPQVPRSAEPYVIPKETSVFPTKWARTPAAIAVREVLQKGALNSVLRFKTFLRVSYYVPYVTASVALVAVWLFLFSKDGMVNQLLGSFAPSPSWLVNSALAMPVIALFVTWKQMGFFILLYLAALQNVSKDLYESASVDGAGRVKSFMNVTVPGVRSATTLVVILATITGANLFTEPYLLTNGGGPDGASTSPVFVMYQKGIEQGSPDTASAIGVILVICVLLISLVNRKLLERD